MQTALFLLLVASASAFVPRMLPISSSSRLQTQPSSMLISSKFMTIVSPFDESNEDSDDAAVATQKSGSIGDGPFELTWENVEMVLDEMRPYLIQDGGNVIIQDIDGPVVRLELQVGYSCYYLLLPMLL
jgi:NifU-like domain